MTTVGNHEMERGNGELGYDGYLARFTLPRTGAAGAPVTYAFRYANVGFVALDGNDASYEIARNQGYTGADQDSWLRRTLTALRPPARSTSSSSGSTTACTAATWCTAPTAGTAAAGSRCSTSSRSTW